MPWIMVLDDEPLIAMMLRDWLLELGCHEAPMAHSVSDALAIVNGTKLDGAILDVSLGESDSLVVAAALLERAIPFAFATGLDPSTLRAGFADAPTLSKPFEFDDVRKLVTKLLARRAP